MEIMELIVLNIQGDRAESALMQSGVLGSYGGPCCSEVGPVTEV